MSVPLQQFSHYPGLPVPRGVPLVESPPHPCGYLPGKMSVTRAFRARKMDGDVYQEFMDAGFRRSGDMFYQPVCPGCRRCVPIRVQVARFVPGKSQRRVQRRNADVTVRVAPPRITDEKFEIYRRYASQRHGRDDESYTDFAGFLYNPVVPGLEFEYRIADVLIGASLCDVTSIALSSVYMYFEPHASRRSPGVFSALHEIGWSKDHDLPYYYLGFWVDECSAMRYKAEYRPHELLRNDGQWAVEKG